MTLVLKLQITEPFSKLEILALLLSPSPPLLNSQPTVINFLSVVPICIRWETFFFLRISHLHLNICQTFRATYFINDFQLLKKKVSFVDYSYCAIVYFLLWRSIHIKSAMVKAPEWYFSHECPLEMEKEITCRRCLHSLANRNHFEKAVARKAAGP